MIHEAMTSRLHPAEPGRAPCAKHRKKLLAHLALIGVIYLIGAQGARAFGFQGQRSIRVTAALSALGPGKYRSLTKIRLRKEPDVASEPTGASIIAGEEFEASEAIQPESPDSPGYLKVKGGWIFDQGIAGRWLGKPIVEPIEVKLPSAQPLPAQSSKVKLPSAQPPPAKKASKVKLPSAQPPPAQASTGKLPSAQPLPAEPSKEKSPSAQAPASEPSTTAPTGPSEKVPTPPEPKASNAPSKDAPAEKKSKEASLAQAEPEVEVVPIPAAEAIGFTKVETMRLPDELLGAGFEFVRLVADKTLQPLTFMLGNGFPCNALTSRGRALVDIEGGEFKGGWLSQAEAQNNVDLKNVQFLESGTKIEDITDCSIMDFPQAMLAEQLGIEVHGILGQPFFNKYDVDVDRYGARADLYMPGDAASQGFYSGVKHLPGIELPMGNLGLAVKGRPVSEEATDESAAFVGLVDSSAAHTVLNWEAAKMLGFTGPNDPRFATAAKVLAASADGSAEEMPVTLVRLSLCSAPEGVKPMVNSVSKEEFESGGGKGWYFEDLSGGDECVEFGAVNVAIGNPLTLSVLADSTIGPFTGAAAIIGQDLLFQVDRLVLNMKDSQVWIQPGEMKDDAEM
ncbi:unnamed protein product [Durusdinium trenchii]|uniref:Uncharacterized protein n=1 Tax=Durusdinium trenchii TaxID=1381693 RepID=A0ABP0SWA3_9DINO